MHIVECLGGEDFIDSVAHDHCCDVMSAQASYLIVCDEQVIKVLVSLAMIERASEIQSIEVVSATALQVIFQHGYKDLRIILPECVCEETVHAYFDVAKRELIIKCDFEAMSSTNRV